MLIINDGSLDIMLQSYNFKPKEGKELQILSCIHVMKDYANHNYFFSCPNVFILTEKISYRILIFFNLYLQFGDFTLKQIPNTI